MTGKTLDLQRERDPKNSLRFYLTIPEAQLGSVMVKQVSLHIQTAEELLANVKKHMAKEGAKSILAASPKLRNLLPSGAQGDSKPYSVKRARAGSTAAHYRVGLQITFADPGMAQAFAQALRVA